MSRVAFTRLRTVLMPGGVRAAGFWLYGRIGGRQVFDVLAAPLMTGRDDGNIPKGFAFISFASAADCDNVAPSLLASLDGQSGYGVRELVRTGGRVYALVTSAGPAAQLNIQMQGAVRIDTPVTMALNLCPDDAFLSFLHTHPAFRRQGLARQLIAHVMRDLTEAGKRRIVAHVSATNVASQNVFLSLGWRRAGRLTTDRSDRIVDACGLDTLGIEQS